MINSPKIVERPGTVTGIRNGRESIKTRRALRWVAREVRRCPIGTYSSRHNLPNLANS
jgi:hypothetical protein